MGNIDTRFRRLPIACGPILAFVLAASIPATLADDGWEGGLLGGVTRFERALTRDKPSFEPTVGLRVGYLFSDRFGWYLDAVHATTDTVDNGGATVIEARTGLDYLFHPERKAHWFLGAGLGVMTIDFDRREDFRNAMFSTGVGQRIRIRPGMHVRWEFRVDISTSRGGFHKTLNDGKILVGLIWGRPGPTP